MITHEIDAGPVPAGLAADELWRLEFRAPVEDYDEVLCWANNMLRREAEEFLANWKAGADQHHIWCSNCPAGQVSSPHKHQNLPEQRGWHLSEISHVRIMPMREAI